jgi:hypothetical protein
MFKGCALVTIIYLPMNNNNRARIVRAMNLYLEERDIGTA